MKFFIKDFFSKFDQIHSFVDLVTFIEVFPDGKLFLCGVAFCHMVCGSQLFRNKAVLKNFAKAHRKVPLPELPFTKFGRGQP